MSQKPVEIFTVLIEVHSVIAHRAVVQCGKKIGERRELLKKNVSLAFSDCPDNEFREGCGVTVFLDQHFIEIGIPAKRANNVVRITGEADTAQMTQIVVFALHATKCGFGIEMRNAAKKFSDNSKVGVPVFIEVDMIGCRKPIYAKVGRIQATVEQWDNGLPEVFVKWIIGGEMAEVFHNL